MYISCSHWPAPQGARLPPVIWTRGAATGSPVTTPRHPPYDNHFRHTGSASVSGKRHARSHFHVWRDLRHLLLHSHPPPVEAAERARLSHPSRKKGGRGRHRRWSDRRDHPHQRDAESRRRLHNAFARGSHHHQVGRLATADRARQDRAHHQARDSARSRGVSILDIRVLGDPALRKETVVVERVTDEVRALITDMFDTMYAAEGIGLAAPQVGRSERVTVMRSEEHT